jgi:peptide/nickel transport system permease protein
MSRRYGSSCRHRAFASGQRGWKRQPISNLRSIYGLDQPLALRYLHWLAAALTGDFGFSRLHARPVLEVLAPALLSTARLMLTSFVLSAMLALGLGIAAALRPGGATDRAVGLFAFTGMSLPTF